MKYGWRPDCPDYRDYRPDEKMLAAARPDGIGAAPAIDLRRHCSPIEDQGDLGACTAHAVIGLVEWYERRWHGKHLDHSRRFLYKTTRNLLGLKGDTGADIRTTIKALVLLGGPPGAVLAL